MRDTCADEAKGWHRGYSSSSFMGNTISLAELTSLSQVKHHLPWQSQAVVPLKNAQFIHPFSSSSSPLFCPSTLFQEGLLIFLLTINAQGVISPACSGLGRGSHRMARLERDLSKDLVPPPGHGPGHLSLNQVSQTSIQPGLKSLQGRSIHNSCGHSVPVSHLPHSKKQ